MEINKNNYEIFFIDYLDGNLSGAEIDQFLDFIEQYPELKAELAGIEDLKFTPDNQTFKNKESLYKTRKEKNEIENFTAIAYMEGDLSELETTLFLKHLDFHPEQVRDLDLLMKTRLQADETIVFPGKKNLYRRGFSGQFIYWGLRTAAVLVLAFASWAVINVNRQNEIIIQSDNLVSNTEKQIVPGELSQADKQQIANNSSAENAEASFSELKKSGLIDSKKQNQLGESVKSNDRFAENIEPLKPIFARLEPVGVNQQNKLSDDQKTPENENSGKKVYTPNSYFVEKILKIKKQENGEYKSLAESGLEIASNATGKHLNYETQEGKVSKIKLDTRLIAFSIPIKK